MTSKDPARRSNLPEEGGGGGPGFWLASLVLAAAPFALFAALLALDHLLP